MQAVTDLKKNKKRLVYILRYCFKSFGLPLKENIRLFNMIDFYYLMTLFNSNIYIKHSNKIK